VNERRDVSPPTVFSEERFQALLTLLADEDPAVRATIRTTLLGSGDGIYRRLQRHRLHPNPDIRRRILELLEEQARRQRDEEFMAFALSHGEQFDLEDGVWRFVLTTYPSANVVAYRAQLDEWAGLIRNRLPKESTAETSLHAVNLVLFGEMRFRGNEPDYYQPANSYLNRVMDRRLGIPITLSLVYLFVARRLGLPLAGIGMPGHFLCRYQSSWEELYVDAFHQGKLLTRIDCKRRIANLAVEYDESFLAPLGSRRILQRLISNLHLIYKEQEQREEMQRLQRYLVALSR
jgi:regulator of sirC expression with transglutaminase-like and TPR domain